MPRFLGWGARLWKKIRKPVVGGQNEETGRCWAPVARAKYRLLMQPRNPDGWTASPLSTARLNKIGNKWLLLYALPCVERQPPSSTSIVSLASLSASARGSIYTLSTKGCPWQPLRKYSGPERRGREEQGHGLAGPRTSGTLPLLASRARRRLLGTRGYGPIGCDQRPRVPVMVRPHRSGGEDVTLGIPTRPAKGVNVSPQADHLVCTWRCRLGRACFELGINACAQRSAVWCLSYHSQSRHRGSIPDERSRTSKLTTRPVAGCLMTPPA